MSTSTSGPARGDVWQYAPQGSPRISSVVIVSSDGINSSSRVWLLAVPVTTDSPRDILGVEIPGHGWVHAGVIIRTYRPWLTERLGRLSLAAAEALDGALRSALDL